MSKTTTLHVHHAFLYISLLSLHNNDVKWPHFKFTWVRERQGDKFYHLCLNSGAARSPELQPKFPSGRIWIIAKTSKRMRSPFSATFSWTSPLSDRKVPIDSEPTRTAGMIVELLLKEVKPFSLRLPRFPAKMTPVNACALLSIEKISVS